MQARRIVALLALAAAAIGCTAAAGASGALAPSLTVSPDASGPAATMPAAIVGSWTTTITEADLRAAGQTGQSELTENSGVFTMRIEADGSWSTAQVTESPIRWPVFKGTSQATGPNSFRQVTTFPADFAGDAVDITWSKTDGALVLHVTNPPDPILPIVMETHPWQPTR